jgi:GAF domain-containing protein
VSASGLAAASSDLARSLQSVHGDVEATLQTITSRVLAGVAGTEHAGITLVTDTGTLESRAATGPLPEKLDALQGEVGEGPCLQALWAQQTVRVDDLATDGRWPGFTARAVEAGVGSMLCFQLFVRGRNLGALNLYAGRPHAFGQDSEVVGLVFATHAAVALSAAQEIEQLRTAMDSHTVVGQATGILMERHRLSAEEAFAVLSRASQDSNTRLREVARRVVVTGSFPGAGAAAPR